MKGLGKLREETKIGQQGVIATLHTSNNDSGLASLTPPCT